MINGYDDDEVGDEDAFISAGDVLQEVPADEHEPMDDGDDAPDDDDDYSPPSNALQAFTAHTGSVFCIAAHPSAPLAASGGEDDLGYIWDITDGEVLVKLTGHTDSVGAVAFSADGEMVATGGMDGRVRVWKRVGPEDYRRWTFVTELQGPDEVMWLRWHPKGNVLLAGSNDTTVWLWQLPSGTTMQVFAGHTGPVQCGQFTPDGKRILTACAEGTLILWDPRSPTPVFKRAPFGDGMDDAPPGITALAVNPASTIAVVGPPPGGVRVVSLSKGEVVGALVGGHKDGESIEAVVFLELGGKDVVVTGGTDGRACVWDLGTMRLRGMLEHQSCILPTSHATVPTSHATVAAPSNGTAATPSSGTAHTGTTPSSGTAHTGAGTAPGTVKEHTGHRAPVLAAALGLGGAVVLGAGDDGVCLVWTTEVDEEEL
ncbi:ribosome biogenesis protein Sqt1 [Hygrophoropsis aurantiaca]|uniref:Ribosome biogenesis protein Sqt1 n=1 Tax=Hygrophoropsis aurantiaca TaxID=72124 RepID=A0ACB8A2M7_9AGAM|nr:ribosome biogenesis protein Sqt1 [Hygrophoropsis aurantiaca]